MRTQSYRCVGFGLVRAQSYRCVGFGLVGTQYSPTRAIVLKLV